MANYANYTTATMKELYQQDIPKVLEEALSICHKLCTKFGVRLSRAMGEHDPYMSYFPTDTTKGILHVHGMYCRNLFISAMPFVHIHIGEYAEPQDLLITVAHEIGHHIDRQKQLSGFELLADDIVSREERAWKYGQEVLQQFKLDTMCSRLNEIKEHCLNSYRHEYERRRRWM